MRRSWPLGPTASSFFATAVSSTRRWRLPARSRCSRQAIGGDGGRARRAVIRWAGRMFQREWRQQILVVTLLTVAVAAAVGSITVAYNASPADDAEFGAADHLLRFDGADPRKLQAGLAAAEQSVGTTDFRAQDPHGAYGSQLLAVRQGRHPVGPGEVAVTDGVADLLQVEIG